MNPVFTDGDLQAVAAQHLTPGEHDEAVHVAFVDGIMTCKVQILADRDGGLDMDEVFDFVSTVPPLTRALAGRSVTRFTISKNYINLITVSAPTS